MNHPPFQVLRENATGPFLIVCDHSTNFVPAHLNDLGLTPEDLARHIAWDIGAAAIAEILSERFHSPAVFCGTSRLVVDCNRQLTAHDLIPTVSDGAIIPGNCNLPDSARQERLQNYFHPYHAAIERQIEAQPPSIFLSVHSMTDRMKGAFRPWPISFSSYRDRSLVEPLLQVLRSGTDCLIGDNEPYDLDPQVDFSTPYHAIRRGLPHIQVEFRQDRIDTREGQELWAAKFGDAIEKAGLLKPGLF